MSFDDDTLDGAYTSDEYVTAGAASWRALARDVSREGATTTAQRLWRAARGVDPITPATARALREVSHRLIAPPAPRTDALAIGYDRETATARALATAWLDVRRRLRALELAGAGDDTWGLRRARTEIAKDFHRVAARRRVLRLALYHVEAA
jgi:hypothetical protein